MIYLPMYNALAMHITYGQKNLINDRGCSYFIEMLNFNDSFIQLSSRKQLRNNIVVRLILEQLKYLHDMRMCLYFLAMTYLLLFRAP